MHGVISWPEHPEGKSVASEASRVPQAYGSITSV